MISITYRINCRSWDVWAWDSRPFPTFPSNLELWGDGGNYQRGHWLNGRSSSTALASVVTDICEQADILEIDASTAYGVVRGFSVSEVGPARSALQSLSIAYGMDSWELEGELLFQTRTGKADKTIDSEQLARSPEMGGAIEYTRSSVAEIAGTVRVTFVEAEGDFDIRTAEAIFPDDSSSNVTQNELPLILTASEARELAERWLAESWVGRDTVRFGLPRSAMEIGPGSVVSIEGQSYRIDRAELSELQLIDGVRVDERVYLPRDEITDLPTTQSFASPLPIFPIFLDLPLLTGEEVPFAPHVAATASPWLGPAAVWSSSTDDGYAFNTALDVRSVIGVTESVLDEAQSGVWDCGVPLRVRVVAGELSSVSQLEVLNGSNVIAIGDGSTSSWEVFQFAEAELVAPSTYELRLRLRGQAGTDGVMPPIWPIGSTVVLLNAATPQIKLPAAARGIERYYRIGVSNRGYNDRNVSLLVLSFQGIGLRPFSVAHLSAQGISGADITLSWVRRTRIDGDSWESIEVPLGEDREVYRVQVFDGTTKVREVEVSNTYWVYTASMQTTDGVGATFVLSVSQLSDRFGSGPYESLLVT